MIGVAFCFVESNVEVLNLGGQLALVLFPLGFIFLVSLSELGDLVFLDLDGGFLVFFLGREVEFVVLYVSVLVLKLGKLLLQYLMLVRF